MTRVFFPGGKDGKLPLSAGKMPPVGASQAAVQVSAMPDAAPGAEIPILMPEKLQGQK